MAESKRKFIQVPYAEGDAIKDRWDEVSVDRTNYDTLAHLLDVNDAAPQVVDNGEQHDPAEYGELIGALTAEAHATGVPVAAMIAKAIQAFEEVVNPTGQGAAKVAATVRQIMIDNVDADEWYNREAITGSGVFSRTGSNQGTIRKWLKENADMIDAHHAKMGIDEDPATHNRRAAQHRRANKD